MMINHKYLENPSLWSFLFFMSATLPDLGCEKDFVFGFFASPHHAKPSFVPDLFYRIWEIKKRIPGKGETGLIFR